MARVSGSIVAPLSPVQTRIILGSKYGNCPKAMPINRIDDRPLQSAPFYAQSGELHWSFAHS